MKKPGRSSNFKPFGGSTGVELGTQLGRACNELQFGDIVGLGRASGASRAIRSQTGGGPISHVALYVGSGNFIHAVVPRVQTVGIQDLLGEGTIENLVVLRPRRKFVDFRTSPLKVDRLISEAAFYSLSLYSFLKALALRVRRAEGIAAADAVFCSEFVALVYERVDVTLVPGRKAASISPNDLLKSPALKDVTAKCQRLHVVAMNWCGEGVPWFARHVRSVRNWFGAFLWAISPGRAAWRLPNRKWSLIHYVAFAGRKYLKLPRLHLRRFGFRLILSIYQRRQCASNPTPEEIQQAIWEARTRDVGIADLSLNVEFGRESVTTEYEGIFPSPWCYLIRDGEKRILRHLESELVLRQAIRKEVLRIYQLEEYAKVHVHEYRARSK